MSPPNAAACVAEALRLRPADERPRFLRELLAHAAAGLVIVEGEREAAEAVYRLADALVARGEESEPAVCPEARAIPWPRRMVNSLRRAFR